MKEDEVQYLKSLYDEYNVEDESQRPPDWTQELVTEFENAFYAAQADALSFKNEVAGVEKLKTKQEEAFAEIRQQESERLGEAMNNMPGLEDALYESKAAYEEARLYTTVGPEALQDLADAYYNAENAYWENRHIISELSI